MPAERSGSARLLGVLMVFLAATCGCVQEQVEKAAMKETGGNPKRGNVAIGLYACGACHMIPGVPGARGTVGPPLNRVGRRAYLGGVLPNTPNNMIRWIQNPQEVDPRTAMPAIGVTERDARDIAAYLYTLR
jgi:cytochrome c